ncbi:MULTISPECIES: YqaJ viral recombinase family protein [unclassified Microbacterium]|uniref:YqaJ viral recombinase family protein n=1 Tax=unclassified Microbacterium TaxID=2609290 RepID=UPI00300FC636
MTPQITAARVVVPADAPREVWLMERGEGVTASRVWAIAKGGIRTWRRELEQMMNGSSFRGTAATRAGSAREDALLDEAVEQLHQVTPNRALWSSVENDLHRATPDGIGRNSDGTIVAVEVKSHEHGYRDEGIPADHMAQLQWQMHVLGAVSGLYGYEIRDEDDQPPADGATWIDVPRDEEMIAFLIYRANQFLAWRDAGCPDVDVDLPEDVAAALAEWAPLKRKLDAAAAAEKKAAAELKKLLAGMPHARRFGAVGMGEHGGFQLIVTESTSFDEDAWEEDNPAVYGSVRRMRERIAAREARAKQMYPITTRRESLRFQEA